MSNRSEAIYKFNTKKRIDNLEAVTSVPSHTHVPSEIVGLETSLDSKQATLVSGTSIKTVNGSSLLGSGDLVVSGGSSSVSGNATITVSNNRFEHEETVTATGVTASSKVSVWLAAGLDSDENNSNMVDLVSLSAIPLTNQITVLASFSGPQAGPIKLQWSAF